MAVREIFGSNDIDRIQATFGSLDTIVIRQNAADLDALALVFARPINDKRFWADLIDPSMVIVAMGKEEYVLLYLGWPQADLLRERVNEHTPLFCFDAKARVSQPRDSHGIRITT